MSIGDIRNRVGLPVIELISKPVYKLDITILLLLVVNYIGIEYQHQQKLAEKVSPIPLPIRQYKRIGDTDTNTAKVSPIKYRYWYQYHY